MNSKNKLLQLILLLFLLLGLVACSVGDEDTPAAEEDGNPAVSEPADDIDTPSDEAVTLTFAVSGWERGLYEQQLDAFSAEHPNITIEFISIDEIFGDGYRNIVPDGEQPENNTLMLAKRADVISWYLYRPDTPDGVLLDLAPFMESDSTMSADDFYPGTLDQFSWDGGVWAIPTQVSYGVFIYNKDMFDAAGIAYPEAGWTWDEMLATAQSLTSGSGQTGEYGLSTQFMGPDMLIQAQAGPMFDYSNDVPVAYYDNPEMIEAFEWYADLFRVHQVAPYAAPPQEGEDYSNYEWLYQIVEQGQVAMWPEYSDAWSWRNEQMNVGIVPFPVSSDNQNSSPILSFNNSLLVSAGTEHPREAWEWVKFLTEQGVLTQPGNTQNTLLPARRSVAEATGVWGQMDEEVADTLRYAVEHGFIPTYPQYGGDAFYTGFEQIMSGEKDVAQVMADAQEEFDTQTEERAAAEPTRVPEFVVAPPPSSQVSEDDVVVNFASGGGDPTLYREIAKAFNEANNGIFVRIVEPNYYNQEDYSITALMADADCFSWWNVPTSPEDVAAVLPLQPFLDADPNLAESDFFPAVLNNFRSQGQIVGLPSEVQVRLMTYNKRVFDTAGVDYPELGWTIDDFLELAVATTSGDDPETKVYGFSPDIYEFGDMMAFMERQGATFIDENQDPPRLNFNDPEVIAAMRWYTNLGTEYEVKPIFDFDPMQGFSPGQEDPYMTRQSLVENDRVAMWTGDIFGVVYGPNGPEQAEGTEHLGFVPYPQGAGGGTGFDGASGYFIASDTQARQECWEWIKHLTAQPSLTPYGVPGRISTASSPEYAQQVGEERAAVYVQSLQNSTKGSDLTRLYQSASWLGPGTYWLQTAFDDINRGEVPVEEALQEAQEKADLYRQCIIDNEYFGDDYMEWEECLREADPEYGQPGA